MLVSLAVIAVLLSLVLTGFSLARKGADSAQCLSSLSQLYRFVTVFSEQQNRGRWPNALEPQSEYAHWVMGDTEIVTSRTMIQTHVWAGPMAAKRYVSADAAEIVSFSCRAAMRRIPANDLLHNPQLYAMGSYYYSAALFTASEMWDPEYPERRARADDFRRSVGLHEVVFPSAKIAYFETGAYHGSGKRLGEFFKVGEGRLNVLCTDGHALMVDPFAQEPPLSAPWSQFRTYYPLTDLLPFSSSAWGFRGIDLR